MCPWVGHTNEDKIKEEILSLSAVIIIYLNKLLNIQFNFKFFEFQDRRNFVRAPPAGVDFEFDYDTAYPVALAIMTEDNALEKMRFELVPKMYDTRTYNLTTFDLFTIIFLKLFILFCSITEENFWRNYFYRVQLIIQAGDLGTLGTDNAFGQRDEDGK